MEKEDLRETKIYLSNVEDRITFQKKMFSLGIKWNDSKESPSFLDSPFYYIWSNMRLLHGTKEDSVRFPDSAYKQIFLHEVLAIKEPKEVCEFNPFDGIMTADEFWEEWSIGAKGLVLLPESIIAGREYEKNQLLITLQGDPTIKGIKASTKNEAIAFIIAAAKTFPDDDSDRFFSKTLIIDTEGIFRGVRINTNTSLNLIPRFDEAQPLYAAVSKGHHVLVPLGADDDFNLETITLPTIDRDGQINSLIKSGVSKDEAEKFSRESGRNITILKKLLGFP